MKNDGEMLYTYDAWVPARLTPPGASSPGQTAYMMYYPTGPAPIAPAGQAKKREVVGWKESDYLDYADFENAMKRDEPISYALCQWLVQQAHGNAGDPFKDSEWEKWYKYALDHCPRFAKEQPRR